MDPGRLGWLTPTAFVAGTFVSLLLVLTGTATYTVQGTPTALRFFDPRRSPTFDETCLVSTIDYALSSNEKNDVIFLGDSVCRTGLDPLRFERETGLQAYNLAIVGDLGPSVILNITKAYLSQHPAPRLIVLCVSPLGLEKDVPQHWIKLRDHFVNCYGFDAQRLQPLEGHLAYTFRQGTVLAWDKAVSSRGAQSHDVRDRPLIGMEQVSYRQFEKLTREKRGHFELSGRGPAKNLDRPGGIVLIDEAWNSGLRRLADTCDAARIPLLIRFGPVSAHATKNLKFERLERWLQQMQESQPQVVVPDRQMILRYSPEICWDYSHPNPRGAQKFTDQVAAEVKRALASARRADSK
jgi:hypothetical protein